MPIEQMNISLPPRMARFIRGRVRAGEYTNSSEVVRDAVRHMQEAEAFKKERRAIFSRQLTSEERESARQGVERGIQDLESGRFKEFDEAGLKEHFAGIAQRGRKRLADAKR